VVVDLSEARGAGKEAGYSPTLTTGNNRLLYVWSTRGGVVRWGLLTPEDAELLQRLPEGWTASLAAHYSAASRSHEGAHHTADAKRWELLGCASGPFFAEVGRALVSPRAFAYDGVVRAEAGRTWPRAAFGAPCVGRWDASSVVPRAMERVDFRPLATFLPDRERRWPSAAAVTVWQARMASSGFRLQGPVLQAVLACQRQRPLPEPRLDGLAVTRRVRKHVVEQLLFGVRPDAGAARRRDAALVRVVDGARGAAVRRAWARHAAHAAGEPVHAGARPRRRRRRAAAVQAAVGGCGRRGWVRCGTAPPPALVDA